MNDGPNMSQYVAEDPGRFWSQISAAQQQQDLFKGLYQRYDPETESVAGLRRRRRRASNSPDDPIKTVSLIEEDGVLYWRDGIPARHFSPHRRRAGRADEVPPPDRTMVLTKQFPALEPNKVMAAIGVIDTNLNPEIDASLCSRLRQLQGANGSFTFGADIKGPFAGRTLVLVHGTFSNAANMLGEFVATDNGRNFLNAAMGGGNKYDRVVFLEHATLAVSPVLNALELGRALAGSSGQIDVIAHSRGGLIVRWWLEAFGSSLRLAEDKPVRVVFAGSPLHGTSLAAPDKLQHAMSLISNIGSFAEATLKLAGAANPFLWVAGKLVEVVVSATGALADTPLIDGLVALIPGLFGQSMISNNYELNRLRLGPCEVSPVYFAVKSNFEPTDPGWKFWQNFRMRVGNAAADIVFPGDNDLVVDTGSMTDLGDAGFALSVRAVQDFGTSPIVWHCNYFRQTQTIDFIKAQFT
jgi:pimeloyl-ACP methyl ester carboxylesterase